MNTPPPTYTDVNVAPCLPHGAVWRAIDQAATEAMYDVLARDLTEPPLPTHLDMEAPWPDRMT